jgi:hypothetical protein
MTSELLSKNVLTLLKGMCWHPDQAVAEVETRPNLRITYQPVPSDLRCCIGQGGKCIKGLQHVASVIARLNGYRASIHLKEDFGQHERVEHTFTQDPTIDPQPIAQLASGLLSASFNREVKLAIKRKNDLLRLETRIDSDGENVLIQALNEPLYAYGYRKGIIIKLCALNGK